eukprot:scaffold65837_cov62-Phaeocystis_antarctica.AAC.1
MTESVLAFSDFVPASQRGVRKSHRRILSHTFGHSPRSPGPTRTPDLGLSPPLRTQHGNKVDTPKIDNIVFTRACRATAPAVGRESRSPHGGESSPRTRLPSPNLAVPRAAPARRGPEGVAHRASACGRGAVES